MTEPADYTGYALYRKAMDAFGDPVFARWICRGYPWGGVDLNRAHEGFLLARDGLTMTGGDARTVLNLLVREVTALEHQIDHEGQAAVEDQRSGHRSVIAPVIPVAVIGLQHAVVCDAR